MAFPPKKGTSGTTAAKKPAVKKKPVKKITFQAPSDFKPAFIELMFKVGADGLAAPQVKATRFRGRWDNPDAKKWDMMEYDQQTVTAIMGRLHGRYFVVNALKRLPANASFKLILRVGKKAADNTLTASVKEAAMLVVKDGAKPKWKWFADKKDPVYRKLRSVNRFLAGAFTKIQLPPAVSKRVKSDDS
jgi:hypothetical protein